MKKWSFILCSVLAIVVAGCSDYVAPIQPVNPENAFNQNIYSSVPVEFGYDVMTKAPMTDEVLSEDHDFRLFSIEEGVQDLTQPGELSIFNAKMNYFQGYGFQFRDHAYYYPKNSDKTYRFNSFYSYYSDVYEGSREIRARFFSYEHKTQYNQTQPGTLGSYDGDILFSKATMDTTDPEGNPEVIDAFNASIIKENGKKPEFQFKHVTAALHFSVTLDLTREISSGYYIKVSGLRIKNSPSQADLWVVNLDDPSKEGTFDPASFRYAEKVTERPFLKNDEGGSGSLNFDIYPDFDSDELSSGYMFIVPQKEPLQCIISVMRVDSILDDGNGSATYYYEFELDPYDYNPELTNGHEAGKLYRYNIVLDWGSTFLDPKSQGPLVRNARQVPASHWNKIVCDDPNCIWCNSH